MSGRVPTTTQQDHEANVFYPTRLGTRYGMMPETQMAPPVSHYLPPPAIPRPHLPPPSHLEPSFAPRSPHVRPRYSDLPARNAYSPYLRHQGYSNPISQEFRPAVQATTMPENPCYGLNTHPPLYPQRVSYQSTNPGTLYEALSPIDYATHGPPPEPSMFNEGGYTATPYPTAGLKQFRPSPASSYHSSAGTSSSGLASAPIPFSSAEVGLERPPTSSITSRYILTIRQQPIAARACGFGERDRRVVDPPPIVQLSLKRFDPRSSSDIAELRWPFNIVHCALLSVSSRESAYATSSDVTAVEDPNQSNRISRRLMGTLVASPFVGTDPEAPDSSNENARLGCFFIFPDLSCRQNGHYKLRFTLMKVSMPNMTEGGQGSIAGSIDSEVFEVFSAKDFPGMRASTALTKELKRQGATVSVKKGKSQRKRGSSASDKSSDDGSGVETAKGRQRKKRPAPS
ncbi:hypothetical protein ACLMJK_004817 [Lecanora helva]